MEGGEDTNPELWQQLKPLFAEARSLPPEQWDAYAREHCSQNDALRQELLAMLAADRRAPVDFLRSPSEKEALLPGQVLAGRFRILSFLGQGGMGQVYAAEDLELGARVAVKALHPAIARDERLLGRFKREVHLARQITHPNVCRIHDLFFDQPVLHRRAADVPLAFVSMELLEGETLADRLAREAPLPLAEALDIARQVASGLAAGHRAGIVHRDLKSANVLLVAASAASSPAGVRAVVADFGVALSLTAAQAGGLTAAGDILGTPGYMAPEQLEGGPVGPAADVYAFGVVLFEMVTGNLPFARRTVRSELSPQWETVILRCLQPEPAARFRSAAELEEALGHLPAENRPRRRQLHRGWPAWAAVLALLAAAPVSIWWRPWRAATAPPAAAPAEAAAVRRSVAVLGFEDLGGEPGTAYIGEALFQMLPSELAAGGALRVVPRETVERLRRDLKLERAHTLSGNTLAVLRAQTAADVVLTGSYLTVARRDGRRELRVDLLLQDAQTGETLTSLQSLTLEEEVLEAVARIGAELREHLGAGTPGAADLAAARALRPANPAAARLYAAGMGSLRRFDAARARDLLREAALADPANALIHSALAEAWAALGYDERAREEAGQAFRLSSALPREEQWRIEAEYHARNRDFAAAARLFAELRRLFPDDLEHGLRLAAAQREAGHPGDTLRTVDELRRLPAPLSADPRLDLEEARAAGAFSFERQQRAAERALARAEAIQAHEMAAEALTLQGQARHRQGDPAGALAALARARTIYRATGHRLGLARLLLVAAAVHRESGELTEAEKLLQEALASFRGLRNRGGETAVLCDLAQCLADRGELPAAREMLEEALALAREIRDPAGLLVAERRLGSVLRQQGDFEAAQSHFEAGLALARSAGNRYEELRFLNSLAFLFKIQGDFLRAEEKLRASSAGLAETGDKAGEAMAVSNLGIVLVAQGKLAEAEECHRRALAAYRGLESRDKMAEELHRLAEVHRYQDRQAVAWQRHQEALSLRRQLGNTGAVARSQLALGKLLLDRGRPGQAEAMLRGAAREFERVDARDFAAEALIALAQAVWEAGRRDEARKILDRARPLAAQSGDATVSLYFALVEARLAAAAGDLARGESRLRTALAAARGAGLPLEMEARLLLGRIRLASGQAGAARTELAALRAEAETHGIALVNRQARELLAGTRRPPAP